MYINIKISATSEKEANHISKILLEKRLVAGTMISEGNCQYWWNGELVENKYWNINAFSLVKHRSAIINLFKELHSDKCPIIAFITIDGNEDFLKWIHNSVL